MGEMFQEKIGNTREFVNAQNSRGIEFGRKGFGGISWRDKRMYRSLHRWDIRE